VVDPDGESTRCPACDTLLIGRSWHAVEESVMVGRDTCPTCGARIPGVFGVT